ncbi:MAG: PilN domain-containing protein, partial [Nitrospirota bacterium]
VPDILTPSAFAVLNFVEFSETRVGGWKTFLGIGRKSRIWGHKEDICISLFIEENYVQSALLKNGLCTQFKSFLLDLDKPQDTLVDDISSELADVRAGTPMEKINKLTLSGDSTVSLPELSSALSSKLGVKTQIIAPLRSIAEDKDTNIQRFASNIGAFYSGLGIGSMKINFLAHRRTFAETKPGSLITRIFFLLIIILAVGIFAGNLINSKRALSKIDELLNKNSPQVETIRKLSSELTTVAKQGSFLRSIKENQFALDVLSELSVIIPSDAWLTNFNYKETYDKENKTTKRELLISGFANSSSALIPILEDSPFLEKVAFAGPITKKNEKEGFKIKATVVKPIKPVEKPKTEVKKTLRNNLKITEGQK